MTGFRISACSANYGHEDLFRVVDRLATHGFHGIEITVMYHIVPSETPLQRRNEIRRYVSSAGLEISALHFIFPGGMSMAAEDSGERQRVADHMVAVMELASDLHTPMVVIGGGGPRSIPEGMDHAVGLGRVLGVYEDMARRSEKLGVMAGFEALNRYETSMGHRLEECIGYVEIIGSSNMKIVGDTFHMNIEEASLPDAIEKAGSRLAHLHFPDSHRLAPGGGHIDFPPILDALRRIDYSGYLSFEFFWISPRLIYLPTFEACDAEVIKGLNYLRMLEAVSVH
ncbi:MAG: sugar phosphate isomerase/epimerase [Chloroflexi bacterium]|nr:sugar phosphate isomerase/epimerase [Chloroflexota bacterium]